MRKWMDLAAPDDPNAWYAISNMWPTNSGTYETADFSSPTAISNLGSGGGAVQHAFIAKTLSGSREYVVDPTHIWEYSGGALTDRTGGVTIGTSLQIMMAQYGDVTICVMGSANATVKSTGGNFSSLAGAPNGEIICVQSNAVLIFNTGTSADGWAASDVGDYTNWSTGEAASGRIIQTPGPILAAVPYGNDVIVFKATSIYRMTYVGGAVKWQVQLVWNGLGTSYSGSISSAKNHVVATNNGVVFLAYKAEQFTYKVGAYLFDGTSPPVQLNPFTTISEGGPVCLYNPTSDFLIIAPAYGSSASGTYRTSGGSAESFYYYYAFATGQWGKGSGNNGEDWESGTTFPTTGVNGVLRGDFHAWNDDGSSRPIYWRYLNITTDYFNRCDATGPASFAPCYLQTTKIGSVDSKTTFSRLTPILRKRTDVGTDSVSLEMTLFREREDTSAQTTRTIAESTQRKRFDLHGGANTDNFARFKVTWTAIDAEVDDFLIISQPAGTD